PGPRPPQRARRRSPEIQFRDVHLPAGPDRYPPAPPTVGIPAATLLRAAYSARDPQRADARRARPGGEGKHRLPPQTDPLRERRRPRRRIRRRRESPPTRRHLPPRRPVRLHQPGDVAARPGRRRPAAPVPRPITV